MVTWIKRDKNDIFAYSWGEKFFKNPKTLFVIILLAMIGGVGVFGQNEISIDTRTFSIPGSL